MNLHKIINQTQTQNRFGEWIPAIPEPYKYALIKECFCGHIFFTEKGYQGHYALEHILYYK